MAARQMNRGRKQVKKVRNYLGRVIRDIERAIERNPLLQGFFREDLDKARKIYAQAGDPKTPNKIYSWHAPEVECIAKGKAHKKYEFGCKTSIASTNTGNFIVGAMAHHGRPYDGNTLGTVLSQIEKLTGTRPEEVYVDLGYRGHGITHAETQVVLARQKRDITRTKRRRQRRRNAIEPIIGHCKNDRKVGPRNWLSGKRGDQVNALAMAIGFNLRKILRWILLYLFATDLFDEIDGFFLPPPCEIAAF
jgi:transposase, IS5 family